MLWLVLLLFFEHCVHAGTIQGIVLEYASGRPLSRTTVQLTPVPSASGDELKPLVLRSGMSGQFVFPRVPPGTYLLVATRAAYFPSGFGQRLPSGRGVPIAVTADSTMFAELRMRHKGAITGRVLDENGIGTLNVPVVAYRARLPLRSAASAVSDDRGVYRIHGLEPGKYWVRSGPHTLEDNTGWLPTFSPRSREIRDSRVYQVTVDADTAYADVSPETGVLFSVGGVITCEKFGPVIVTLSSESFHRVAQSGCGAPYGFVGVPQGAYEMSAALVDDSESTFNEFTLGGNTKIDLTLTPSVPASFEYRRAGSNAPLEIPIKIAARRRYLSDTGPEVEITERRRSLSAGYWQLRAAVPTGSYVESIANTRVLRTRRLNPNVQAEAFEIYVPPELQSSVRVIISDAAGQLSGTVFASRKPVGGAPVFLWPVSEVVRRSLGGAREVLSNTDGRYQFDSLPPGEYRLLASFDVSEIDEDMAEASRAPVLRVEPSKTLPADLELWSAPF